MFISVNIDNYHDKCHIQIDFKFREWVLLLSFGSKLFMSIEW